MTAAKRNQVQRPGVNESNLVWENRERIRALEVSMGNVCNDINEIKNNHLVHLQSDITDIKKTLSTIELRNAKIDSRLVLIGMLVVFVINFLADVAKDYILR